MTDTLLPPLRVLTGDDFADLPVDVHDAIADWITGLGHDPALVVRVAWSTRQGMGWLRLQHPDPKPGTPSWTEVVLRNVTTPPDWSQP